MTTTTIFSTLFSKIVLFCTLYDQILYFVTVADDYSITDSRKLSIKDLRILFDRRGQQYSDFKEKSDFIDALKESGHLTVGELNEAKESMVQPLSDAFTDSLVTEIAYKKGVLEKVFDSQQEIWLIHVVSNDEKKAVDKLIWRRLIRTFYPFGIQFGRFDCSSAVNFCKSKGWNAPSLVLVTPKRSIKRSREAAQFDIYTLAEVMKDKKRVYDVESVLKQVYSLQHNKLVRYLPTKEVLNHKIVEDSKCSGFFVLLTNLRHCPFLISALAAKFNDGKICFSFGPKAIADKSMVLTDNQLVAIYAFRNKNSEWQILNGSSNVILTLESLSKFLNDQSSIAEKLINAVSSLYSFIQNLWYALWYAWYVLVTIVFVYILLLIFLPARRHYGIYLSNGEIALNREEYIYVVYIFVMHGTEWYKRIFARYRMEEYICEELRTKLDEYDIDIDAIGFPPYNWILRLPTIDINGTSDSKVVNGASVPFCPICQTIAEKSSSNFLCRLPCECKDIVYHFDCIVPWLIQRDASAHSLLSNILHTKRQCPTCRFDLTTWGVTNNQTGNDG